MERHGQPRRNHQQVTRLNDQWLDSEPVWHSFLAVRIDLLDSYRLSTLPPRRRVAVSDHYPQHSVVLQDASRLAEDGDQTGDVFCQRWLEADPFSAVPPLHRPVWWRADDYADRS